MTSDLWCCWLIAQAARWRVVDDALLRDMDGGAQAWWLPDWPCQYVEIMIGGDP